VAFGSGSSVLRPFALSSLGLKCLSIAVNRLRNRLYYVIKPWIPTEVRWALRRWYGRRQRSRVGMRWPVLPGSDKQPARWPGWPEGKQFAVVLTHDVEGPLGLSRCRQLM